MLLFEQCRVCAPQDLGRQDVLVGGGRVLAMAPRLAPPSGPVEVVPAAGLTLVPGLIDCHVHIAGAGGEGGPASRTAEMSLAQMAAGGITTVVGCLGTDGLTRNVESVLMKAKALRAQGVSAWIYTGAYQVPTPTITGSVGRDIALIEEVIGVGEIAIADHRSSGPTADELVRLASQARVGGMIGGKGGIVNLHLGDGPGAFELLADVCRRGNLPASQFLPTHCNRSEAVFTACRAWATRGYVDITASSWRYFQDSEVKPSRAAKALLAEGVPPAHITFSSDGCGSLPEFDADGRLLRISAGEPASIFHEMADLVREEQIPLETALRVVTSNVADILKLPAKGRVRVDADADLLFLDDDLRIRHLLANGRWLVRDGAPVH